MSREHVFSTVIVSPEDAVAYIRAGYVIGMNVGVFRPETLEERRKAVALHVQTLLIGHQPPEEERDQFITIAHQEMDAAFGDPESPAVMLTFRTAAGDEGVKQANRLSELALNYLPMTN